MIKLEDLLEEDEQILDYWGIYKTYHCIIPNNFSVEYGDLWGCIEDTFYRILENGGTDEDLYYFLGAEILDEELRQAYEDEEEGVDIDLGYMLLDSICGCDLAANRRS